MIHIAGRKKGNVTNVYANFIRRSSVGATDKLASHYRVEYRKGNIIERDLVRRSDSRRGGFEGRQIAREEMRERDEMGMGKGYEVE